MALISQTKGRKDPSTSAYFRLFAETADDPVAFKIAQMVSKIHATTIRNGCLLDGSILANPAHNPNNPTKDGNPAELVTGHYVKLRITKEMCPSITGQEAIEIDYTVVTPDEIHIYEVKDGDNFDTKKSKGEVNSLKTIQAHLMATYPTKTVSHHIVFWNSSDAKTASIKVNDLAAGVLITGSEFCSKIGINFENINEGRRRVASRANKEWFLSQLKVFDN